MSLDRSSLRGLLRSGETLIIVPPFAAIDRPSLAAHTLQAVAAAAGFSVTVLYANLAFAAALGPATYDAVVHAPQHILLGERLFARSAHDLPPFGEPITDAAKLAPPLDDLPRLEEMAFAFAEAFAAQIAALPFKVIGATTTFEQTNPSLALLGRIKRACPEIITILGGANCEGEMAQGIASLGAGVDHIFSGEAEASFPDFLRRLAEGREGGAPIIEGAPCRDLDSIPTPDFTEYFAQRALFLAGRAAEIGPAMLPYESSRGCWWGQKHHCTFCGLNGEGMAFREKSPDRVLTDLRALAAAHEAAGFSMADNIMPHAYFKTLIPRLAADPLPIPVFYEQKSNLTLENVLALKQAGVTSIQPGIEALSSALLRIMDKGVLARQNVMLLRYARAVGLDVQWNLLWGFPGDEPAAYEETLALLPLLRHLQPPTALIPISVDRFSPYFQRPAAYGIRRLSPNPAYRAMFPARVDIEKAAYRFAAEYDSGAQRCPDVIRAIEEEIAAWRARWTPAAGAPLTPPTLRAHPLGDSYLVRDTRGLPGTEEALLLDRDEARAVLRAAPFTPSPAVDRAIAQRIGVVIDGDYVPLVTASAALLLEIEREQRPARRVHLMRSSPIESRG